MNVAPARRTIRAMVFNVEEGGDRVDLALVVEAIRRADPDVVAIQEAMGNTARIAECLGWEYASVRTQVISRLPIHDPGAADPGLVFVEVDPMRFVAVASVHLPAEPYGPELARRGGTRDEIVALERRSRLTRLESMLARLVPLAADGLPVILMGDFNAPSHLDWTTAMVGIRSHVREAVDWPISRSTEAAGFRDAWRELHPDPVAAPGLTWPAPRLAVGGWKPGPDEPADRIDMILVAGPVTPLDCSIVGEERGPEVSVAVDPWPSDHRALVATLEMIPGRLRPAARHEGLAAAGTVISRRDESPAAPFAPVSIAASKPVFRVGEPVEVRWEGGPGYRWDWIAIFDAPAEDVADAHLAWRHTGAATAGRIRLDAASTEVDQSSRGGRWPLPPGRYIAAYLFDDSPLVLGRAAFRIEG